MSAKSIRRINEYYNWQFEDDGREAIREWSRKRIQKMQGFNKSYYGCLVYTFHLNTMKSFVENFNFMVILQMVIAAASVYLFDHYDIYYNFSVALFVSPIVFPLAFSINTDFQRREKVLDDLANFKSSSMLWFFCMREWKLGAGLNDIWMNEIQKKLHSIMFNLREYLLTSRCDRRNIIARYMYEDYSDSSQLIERVRDSKLPANPALISRSYHLLNAICLSFERLRVVREYRSPRSIRSFNKVLVLLLPVILCPYFVSLSRAQGANKWGPYLIAVLVAAVFGALQGVQDKLDDPFDGMSEDDINLDTIDEWTFNSLDYAAKRDFEKFGRFVVTNTKDAECGVNQRKASRCTMEGFEANGSEEQPHKKTTRSKSIVEFLQEIEGDDTIRSNEFKNRKRSVFKRSLRRKPSKKTKKMESDDSDSVLYSTNGEVSNSSQPSLRIQNKTTKRKVSFVNEHNQNCERKQDTTISTFESDSESAQQDECVSQQPLLSSKLKEEEAKSNTTVAAITLTVPDGEKMNSSDEHTDGTFQEVVILE